MACITQTLGIYIQALLRFCPDSVGRELGQALHLYTDLLHTIDRPHTLGSLKAFHFDYVQFEAASTQFTEETRMALDYVSKSAADRANKVGKEALQNLNLLAVQGP